MSRPEIKFNVSHLKVTGMMILLWIISLSACVTPESSLADQRNFQNNVTEYRRKYEVVFDSIEKPIRFGYHYIVSEIPAGFRVRVFHPDKKTLTDDATYSTDALSMLHGPCTRYWDDGSIREQGVYQFGRRHGVWLESEPGKGKSASGEYLNHRKEGIWTQLDSNGVVESVYTWHDNTRHGKFFLYDQDGTKVNEGLYKSDSLIATLFPLPIKKEPYLAQCAQSYFSDPYTCSDFMTVQIIQTHLKYPQEAREHDIEGIAVIQWKVMPDGTIEDVRVPHGLSDEIEAECRKAVSHLTEFVPGTIDGKPVPFPMQITINFSR